MAKMTKREFELEELRSWVEKLAAYEGVPFSRTEPWGLYLADGPNGEYYIRQNWVSVTGKIAMRPRFFTYAQKASLLIDNLSAACDSHYNVAQMRETLAEMEAE
jgi:hypothetical protein